MVDALFLLVLLGVAWAVSSEGLFGAALMLINVTVAGLVAMNFWQPLSSWLQGLVPRIAIWLEVVSLCVLFTVTLLALRFVTEMLSPLQVRFPKALGHFRWLFGLWTGWVVVGFLMVAMQTTPLPRSFFGYQPEREHFLGMGFVPAPERVWLGFFQRSTEQIFDREGSADDPTQHVFDPEGLFLPSYASWRDMAMRPAVPTTIAPPPQ